MNLHHDINLPSLPKGALKLLVTAEQLFGERGIEGVSLRQIVTAAGQANSSAVQHHFGSKEGLVQAVYDMRIPALDANRQRLLDRYADDEGYIPVSSLLKAMFMPVVDNMDESAQKSFALFNSQLMQLDVASHPFTHSTIPQPAYRSIYQRLGAELNYLPQEVLKLRLRLATDLFFGGLNEYRQLPTLSKEMYATASAYWNELLLAMEALLRQPYTGSSVSLKK